MGLVGSGWVWLDLLGSGWFCLDLLGSGQVWLGNLGLVESDNQISDSDSCRTWIPFQPGSNCFKSGSGQFLVWFGSGMGRFKFTKFRLGVVCLGQIAF